MVQFCIKCGKKRSSGVSLYPFKNEWSKILKIDNSTLSQKLSFICNEHSSKTEFQRVTMMLDHFVDLHIETIWITPWFPTAMRDTGYDVKHYTEVDPRFGTLDDFDNLVSQIKQRNMKLVMDVVINHSSDEHPWFNKSINKIVPYTDYYVWKDPQYYTGGQPQPPNNWRNNFGRSAWKWNENRKQFYLHNFGTPQPDLNLRNPNVVHEIYRILEFWLNRGVDGLRLDAAPWYFEDDQYENEESWRLHKHTMNQPETLKFIHELRKHIDRRFNKKRNKENEIVMIAESVQNYDINLNYYGNNTYPIVHFPFNFDFALLRGFNNAEGINIMINNWLNNIPSGSIVNWVSETHNVGRLSRHLHEEYADLVNILIMLLPGSVTLYYGQEIGMKESRIRNDLIRDLWHFRDNGRTPMQWDDSPQAGFSTNKKLWLPVNPDYRLVNVERMKIRDDSRYHKMKELSQLRQTETIKNGAFHSYIASTDIYIFTRSLPNYETYLVLTNLGSVMEKVILPPIITDIPTFVHVATSSINSGHMKGSRIRVRPKKTKHILMRPYSSIVLKYKPKQP